jgi:hypothetical protein
MYNSLGFCLCELGHYITGLLFTLLHSILHQNNKLCSYIAAETWELTYTEVTLYFSLCQHMQAHLAWLLQQQASYMYLVIN